MMSKGYSSKIKLMIGYKITANCQLPTVSLSLSTQHFLSAPHFLSEQKYVYYRINE